MEANWFVRGLAKLEKVRTPLALGGLAVLVLFFLYKKILELGVFSQLTDNQTYKILDLLMNNVFWLAIIAVILGALSYILQLFIRPSSNRPASTKSMKGKG